ncbi:hypothetical protein LFM09_17720 [Lentzea alba]
MTSTPIFDALAAELLTTGQASDGTTEAADQPGHSADSGVQLTGRLE